MRSRNTKSMKRCTGGVTLYCEASSEPDERGGLLAGLLVEAVGVGARGPEKRSTPSGGREVPAGYSSISRGQVSLRPSFMMKLTVRGRQARCDRSSSSGGGCGAEPPRANTGLATTDTGACGTTHRPVNN